MNPPPIWLSAYGVLAVVHLIFLGLDSSPGESITKVLLVPVLIAWTWVAKAPKIVPLALLFCLAGDAFLLKDDLFAAGMAAFAAAHICLIVYFVSRNAWAAAKAEPLVPTLLLVGAVVLVAVCWTGFDDAVVRYALPVYAALLASMAGLAWSFSKLAGLGAASFVVSDALIALSEAGRIADRPAVEVAIMALYYLALALIVKAILEREAMRPTDPWPTEKSPLLD